MAFKTFASGDVLTAAEMNTYLMQQAVIVCTSATRPGSPVEGMTIFETDTDEFNVYDGSGWVEYQRISAWTSYTPTWTNLTVGNSTVDYAYVTEGKTVKFRGSLVLGSTGSVTGTISCTIPVTGKTLSGSAGRMIGDACYEDLGTRMYGGTVSVGGGAATSISFHHDDAGNNGNVNATAPFTFATGDAIYWYIEYQSA